jgi:hypothetical protein
MFWVGTLLDQHEESEVHRHGIVGPVGQKADFRIRDLTAAANCRQKTGDRSKMLNSKTRDGPAVSAPVHSQYMAGNSENG